MRKYSCTRKCKICLTGSVLGSLFQNAPLGEEGSSKHLKIRQKLFNTCCLLSYTVHRVTEDLIQNLKIGFINSSRPFDSVNFGRQLFGGFKIDFLSDILFFRLVKEEY